MILAIVFALGVFNLNVTTAHADKGTIGLVCIPSAGAALLWNQPGFAECLDEAVEVMLKKDATTPDMFPQEWILGTEQFRVSIERFRKIGPEKEGE